MDVVIVIVVLGLILILGLICIGAYMAIDLWMRWPELSEEQKETVRDELSVYYGGRHKQ